MCHCDHDPPEFFFTSLVRGRRTHRCCECLATISVGQRHEVSRGKWDGRFEVFRTCEDCLQVRAVMKLECWAFGELYEEAVECRGVLPVVREFLERREANQLLINNLRPAANSPA